jgi:hypothetical protein
VEGEAMPFLLYERRAKPDGTAEFFQLKDVSLAGTSNGLIYPFVRRYAPPRGVFAWHATAKDLLAEAGIRPRDRAVVVDVNPRRRVSLYELTDVWGHSYAEWTPIAVRLETLFIDLAVPDPPRYKQRFSDRGCARKPVHQFLHLKGGLAGGSWTWGPVGSVSGAMLPPDALEYFIARLQESLGRSSRAPSSRAHDAAE